MANYWEEALDIDDSDLLPSINPPSLLSNPVLLKPCSSSSVYTNPSVDKNPSLASSRVVPGPAGTVQMSMNRIKKRDLESLGSEMELSDMGFDEIDCDFLLDSWVYAMQFVGKEIEITRIGSIATRAIDRIPWVVALVKICTPNGLGDLFLTLKDETGTIGASIHRKVMLDKNLASDITIGSVLVLKQVVVFSPTRSMQYLNITIENLVKIIGKNCGLPKRETLSQMENSTNRRELTNKTLDFPKILSNVNPNKNATTTVPTNNLPKCHETGTSDVTRGSNEILSKISGDIFSSQISKNHNFSENLTQNTFSSQISKKDNLSENLKPTQENNEKDKVVSRVSVPEWTDDQLSQLFSDY